MFQGLNYYGRVSFHHGRPLIPARGQSRTALARRGNICDDMVERHPPGLTPALLALPRHTRLPLYLTEHGAASADELFRITDLRANLRALHAALAHGVDVRGFFYWSLLDNFEWQLGCTKNSGCWR